MTDSSLRKAKSGSETRQRGARPAMRCSAAEMAQLQAAAERAGLTVGAFMRHQCLGTAGPRAVRRAPVERLALAQLLGQLGKAGSNLNQIARVLNSGKDWPAVEISAAIEAIRDAGLAISAVLRGKQPA